MVKPSKALSVIDDGARALRRAVEAGDATLVEALFARGSSADGLGETLLHRFAAAGGEARLIKLALDHKLNVGAANALGETPLHLLMMAKEIDTKGLATLLGAKCSVDAVDAAGKTPLHRAAAREKGGKTVAALLTRKARVDLKDSFGRTPLHYAAAGSDPAIVSALLEARAAVDVFDEFGLSPRDVARITRSKAGATIAADKVRAPRVLRRHEALGEPLLKALKGPWQRRILDVLPLVRLRIPLVASKDPSARSKLFARSAPLPPGTAWPILEGARRSPHAAIAVIDLRDLKAFDFEGLFPDGGTLVLFEAYDADFAGGDATASLAQARIVPADLPETARPAAADELYKTHPAELRVGFGAPTLELPDPRGSPLLGDDDDREQYEALRARVREIDVAKLLGTKLPALVRKRDQGVVAALLGHTAPMAEVAQPLPSFLAARNLPARAHDDAAARDVATTWRVLASIGVHGGSFDHDHVWLIDERDLEARKLEAATYVFDLFNNE